MNNAKLIFKYALFACAAIAFNLLTQYICLQFYKGIFNLYIAILLGTAVGLLIKYFLDKKYIFYFQPKTQLHNIKKFIFYSGTGVFTTIIFWGFELLFNWFLKFEIAKFLGALIGLLIGYFIKYNLDKKFVFIKQAESNE
ncbi:MAG: GtrA family protein [Candidatus Staskawiczbacteria bacterium]|jgi:putative flippase GtrA